jgi:hypothetical protein
MSGRTSGPKGLRSRLDAAFPDGDEASAEKFLEKLYPVWKDITDSMRRSVLLLVLAVVVFELLNRSVVEEASVGPLKIKDLQLLQTAIPIFVAYVFYDLVTLAFRWTETELVFAGVMKRCYKQLYNNEFELLLYPPTPSMFALATIPSVPTYRHKQLVSRSEGFIVGSVLGLPLLFQAYGFFQLFRHGEPTIFIWISFLFSSLLILFTYFLLALFAREPSEAP